MSRTPYTPQDEETIKALYPTHTAAEVAAVMHRSIRSVYVKAHLMGLTGKPHPRKIKLTQDAERMLRKNFPHVANAILASILVVSPRTVIRRARALGLVKTEQFMREAQAHMAKKAKESHLRNGTYPPKGVVNANLAKGEQYRFKKHQNNQNNDNNTY